MIAQEDFERIEAYLENRLSKDEKITFQNEMKVNVKLKDAVEEVRNLGWAVQKAVLKEKLATFHQAIENELESSLTIRRHPLLNFKWAVAASVLIIVGISIVWYVSEKKHGEAIFEKYFVPDPGLMTAMGSTQDYLFHKAMLDYKLGNYDAAIKGWESLIGVRSENDSINYFLGSAYLAKGDANNAIPHIEKVASDSLSNFKSSAYWYLGLAYLKIGNISKAELWINKSDNKNVTELLKELY